MPSSDLSQQEFNDLLLKLITESTTRSPSE
jgi:hypothetical protein